MQLIHGMYKSCWKKQNMGQERILLMREKAMWAVLHKSWEESMKSDRTLLRQLMLKTTGEQLWSASEPELIQRFPEIPMEVWQCFVKRRNRTDLEKVESYLNQHHIHILLYHSSSYPAILREIHQPPAILYWKGNFSLADLNIAVVGSRKADSYGLSVAEQLGSDLSKAGVCVVSGLARGIDAKSHKGALNGSGGTIAVQGCGIDRIYPKENSRLAEQILAHEKGCIITEFPLGSIPSAWHFPQRNRIISGLSQGVVIVQAAVKSGAFITVETALEQGRDVFAVPGQINNPLSAGPHRFLQEGARLITGVDDILEEYGQKSLFRAEEVPESKMALTKEEERVLQYITAEPVTIEEIAYLSRLSMAELMPLLSMLELYGLVKQMIGRKYIRIG